MSYVIFLLSTWAFIYLIVSMQVWAGFPPFYRKLHLFSFLPDSDQESEIKKVVPFVFGIVTAMVVYALTEMSVFLAVFGVGSAWCALRIRSLLRNEREVLPLWLLHPITVRWPMLVFDVWTLGAVAVYELVMFSANY